MIMKRVFFLFLFLALVIPFAASAERPLGVEEFTSVDQLTAEILSYFPKIQGEVKTVQGDRLTIGLGTKNGLVPGVTLTLWRDGKEILHPVTGAVIGRTEDAVGSVEVTGLTETTCTALILKKVRDPQVGDKARITPKKLSLALVPVRADRPDILQDMSQRLSDSGRFLVLENDKVAAFLKDRKQRDSSLIQEMNKTYNLDVVAAVSVYPSEGGKLLVTTRLFYADEARPLDTIVAMLDLKSKKEFGEIKPFFAPVKEDKLSIPSLPFDAQFLAAADFEGSGTIQYAFSDGMKLHIYRQEQSGWHEEWVEPASEKEMRQINLDVADINGNGRPQLFVTAVLKDKVFSYVIEYRDGIYQRIADLPGFLRIIQSPGKGAILIGQNYNPKTFYAGQPKQYVWSNGSYIAGSELPLPKGVKLYGFTYAAVGEPNPLLVALDDKNRVLVYSGDSMIWKSPETYSSVGLSVKKPVISSTAVISQSVASAESSEKIRIAGRVLALDMNGDGREEIVLPENKGDSFFGIYTQADFVCLGWTGARLEQRWNIKDIPGAVVDFQIVQQQGAGAQIIAIVKSSGGLFSASSVGVMSYTAK
jgi:hypothetical protein